MLQKYFPNFAAKTQSVMQKDIKRFFHPINQQMNIPDCEYDRTGLCIAMAKALARNTNHSLYIIDYNRKNFLYVSSNPLFLCGHSPESGFVDFHKTVYLVRRNDIKIKSITFLLHIFR